MFWANLHLKPNCYLSKSYSYRGHQVPFIHIIYIHVSHTYTHIYVLYISCIYKSYTYTVRIYLNHVHMIYIHCIYINHFHMIYIHRNLKYVYQPFLSLFIPYLYVYTIFIQYICIPYNHIYK